MCGRVRSVSITLEMGVQLLYGKGVQVLSNNFKGEKEKKHLLP